MVPEETPYEYDNLGGIIRQLTEVTVPGVAGQVSTASLNSALLVGGLMANIGYQKLDSLTHLSNKVMRGMNSTVGYAHGGANMLGNLLRSTAQGLGSFTSNQLSNLYGVLRTISTAYLQDNRNLPVVSATTSPKKKKKKKKAKSTTTVVTNADEVQVTQNEELEV